MEKYICLNASNVGNLLCLTAALVSMTAFSLYWSSNLRILECLKSGSV